MDPESKLTEFEVILAELGRVCSKFEQIPHGSDPNCTEVRLVPAHAWGNGGDIATESGTDADADADTGADKNAYACLSQTATTTTARMFCVRQMGQTKRTTSETRQNGWSGGKLASFDALVGRPLRRAL